MRNTTTRRHGFAAVAILAALGYFAAAGQPADAIVITWSNKAASGFDAKEKKVIDAAIMWWSQTITKFNNTEVANRNTFTIKITEVATEPSFGTTGMFKQDANGIPLSSDIEIDSGDKTDATKFEFFVDETPHSSKEFKRGNNPYHGIPIAGGPADGKVDLLEVIKHELGHALGFSDVYTKWAAAIVGTTLTYAPGKTATIVPGIDHLDETKHPDDLMGNEPEADILAGQRWLQSPLDLDILAGIYGYTVDKTKLETIPEPMGAALLAFGLAVLTVARRRARAHI